MADHIQIDDTSPRIAYTATAGQTVFVVPFAFFDNEDLKVYVNDELQTLDTDYTAAGSGASEPSTRLVTFETGLTLNDSVVILRELEVSRTSDFPTSGPLSITALNTSLDKIFAILQQIISDTLRSLRLPDSDETESLELPTLSERASKFLAFDADGEPIAATAAGEAVVSAFMATVLDDADAASARTTLGIANTDFLQAYVNWQNFR